MDIYNNLNLDKIDPKLNYGRSNRYFLYLALKLNYKKYRDLANNPKRVFYKKCRTRNNVDYITGLSTIYFEDVKVMGLDLKTPGPTLILSKTFTKRNVYGRFFSFEDHLPISYHINKMRLNNYASRIIGDEFIYYKKYKVKLGSFITHFDSCIIPFG